EAWVNLQTGSLPVDRSFRCRLLSSLLLWEGNIFLSTIFLSLWHRCLLRRNSLCGFLCAKFCFALRRFLLDWTLYFRPDEGASFISVDDILYGRVDSPNAGAAECR